MTDIKLVPVPGHVHDRIERATHDLPYESLTKARELARLVYADGYFDGYLAGQREAHSDSRAVRADQDKAYVEHQVHAERRSKAVDEATGALAGSLRDALESLFDLTEKAQVRHVSVETGKAYELAQVVRDQLRELAS